MSSNRFGGRGALARSRVQVRSTGETETGTVFPTEQQTGGDGKRQLLPRYVPDVYMRGAFKQRIEVGIVRGFGIGAEDRGIHVDVNVGADLGQAAPALALHDSVKAAPPEVLAMAGGLQLSRHRHRADQIQVQPIERGIVGLQLSHRPNRSPLKVPDVHSQHSRLK